MRYLLFFLLLAATSLSGCAFKSNSIQSSLADTGDLVSISFDVWWWDLDNLFLTTNPNTPLSASWNDFIVDRFKDSFVVGDSSFFSPLVWHKKVGESFNGILTPKDLWYDQYYDSYRVQRVPLKALDLLWIDPVVWGSYDSNGQLGIIVAIDDANWFVTVDFNPFYTWNNIAYRVTIDSVEHPNH